MIKLAYCAIPKKDTEYHIKKISESLPTAFSRRNSDHINKLLSRKNRKSALQSLLSLKLLTLLLPCFESELIRRTEMGRPFFEGRQDIDFSISHSEDLVLCAVNISEGGLAQRIGVDCERIERKDPSALAERFFAACEKEDYLSSADKQRCFAEIWTKKEAYVKHLGTGLSTPFPSFDTSAPLPVAFQSFEIMGNIVTVCAEKECFPCALEEPQNICDLQN